MKQQKIKKILTDAKAAELWEDGNKMWLGDGSAMYALEGMPKFGMSVVPILYDISMDKFAEFMQTEEERPEPEEAYRGLVYAQIGAEVGEIIIAGVSYTPVLCKGNGIRFVKTRYLVPLEEETTFEIGSTSSGKEALICKEGLFVAAIIEFVPISRSFVSALGGLYTYAQAELRKNKEKENENADTAD